MKKKEIQRRRHNIFIRHRGGHWKEEKINKMDARLELILDILEDEAK